MKMGVGIPRLKTVSKCFVSVNLEKSRKWSSSCRGKRNQSV